MNGDERCARHDQPLVPEQVMPGIWITRCPTCIPVTPTTTVTTQHFHESFVTTTEGTT